ncbi:MAG: EamA family transporter [Actinobacteria bacterium]|nr:EamA family transporter [Actinomycetota bacterium]
MIAAAYALLASLSWGTSDYLAGRESRRSVFWGVALLSQGAALAGATVALLVAGRAPPSPIALGVALLGGVCSAVAALAQYRAFALIKMSVVSPIMAGAALVPVAWGLARGEHPTRLQLAGMALTIIGIVAISRPARDAPAERARTNRTGVLLTLLAAVLAGLMLVALDYAGAADPYWAVAALRLSSVIVLAGLVSGRGRGMGLRPGATPVVMVVGVLIVAANLLFTTASTIGYLSVVAVLGYLSPAVVIFWAWAVLHERLRPLQWCAAVLVLAGVVCLALG